MKRPGCRSRAFSLLLIPLYRFAETQMASIFGFFVFGISVLGWVGLDTYSGGSAQAEGDLNG
jgi:hypothetical protein